MNIAWISPEQPWCGIATYTRRYLDALAGSAEIIRLDPALFYRDRSAFLSALSGSDIAHVQYEPSFFFDARRDFFPALCRSLRLPLVISLHEVYDRFPDVYPREAIAGNGPLAAFRRLRYDLRHPRQTAYRNHARRSFYSTRVLVHYDFQKALLTAQGCASGAIAVLPHPVPAVRGASPPARWAGDRPLRLAASGYVNPHFDYDLLFATLERLAPPWRFSWIGGARRDEDARLHSSIIARAQEKGWSDRFSVTGRLSENTLHEQLCAADIVCAFFSHRSSSGSLTEALGALRPVIATPLPLTEELARSNTLLLSPPHPDALALRIQELATDETVRAPIIAAMNEYRRSNSYPALATRLLALYSATLRSRERGKR